MGSLEPGGWAQAGYVRLGNRIGSGTEKNNVKGLLGKRVEGRVIEFTVLTCSSHA